MNEGGSERGRHRIWNRLQALSCQHRARRGAQTHGPRDHDLSRSRPLNRLSHPGAPIFLYKVWHSKTLEIDAQQRPTVLSESASALCSPHLSALLSFYTSMCVCECACVSLPLSLPLCACVSLFALSLALCVSLHLPSPQCFINWRTAWIPL